MFRIPRLFYFNTIKKKFINLNFNADCGPYFGGDINVDADLIMEFKFGTKL